MSLLLGSKLSALNIIMRKENGMEVNLSSWSKNEIFSQSQLIQETQARSLYKKHSWAINIRESEKTKKKKTDSTRK